MRSKNLKKVVSKSTEEESLPGSPVDEMEAELPERCQKPKDVEYSTPVRQSGRTTGKTFKYELSFPSDFFTEVFVFVGTSSVSNLSILPLSSQQVYLTVINYKQP